MNRHERGKRAAIKAARLSEFYAHRVGAALFLGNRLLSLDCNKHKTHPLNTCYSQHAEFSVSLKWKHEKLKNSTLYVARLTRTDRVSYAKPCDACQDRIKDLGIGKVYYTNYVGDLEELVTTSLRLTG